MISSGVHLRHERRIDHSRNLNDEKTKLQAKKDENYHEQSNEIPISIDFMGKILIWSSINFVACLLILIIEITLNKLYVIFN